MEWPHGEDDRLSGPACSGRPQSQAQEEQGERPASLTYYEKTPPAFQYGAEMEEAHKTRLEMLRLQTAIAVANATTEIDWQGKKILVAFAVRYLEELRDQLSWLDALEPLLLDQKEQEEDKVSA